MSQWDHPSLVASQADGKALFSPSLSLNLKSVSSAVPIIQFQHHMKATTMGQGPDFHLLCSPSCILWRGAVSTHGPCPPIRGAFSLILAEVPLRFVAVNLMHWSSLLDQPPKDTGQEYKEANDILLLLPDAGNPKWRPKDIPGLFQKPCQEYLCMLNSTFVFLTSGSILSLGETMTNARINGAISYGFLFFLNVFQKWLFSFERETED